MGEQSRELDHKLQNKMIDQVKNLYRMVKYRDTIGLYYGINMKDIYYQINTYGYTSKWTHERHKERGLLNPKSGMIPFSYYPLDYIIRNDDLRASGPNILLGNSASASNNHLEAFDLLKKLELNDRKIVTPLSYGQEDYADAIEESGNNCYPTILNP